MSVQGTRSSLSSRYGLKRTRRIGAEHSATRSALLDATEQLMRAEGYAAVSTRRVAKEVGPTPALVHYYFPTTDDLLVAVYRRAVERTQERFTEAVASKRPLRALWALSTDPSCTALAMEFMALANHRKVIRTEIARSAMCFRKMQADALKNLTRKSVANLCPPLGLTVLMAGISRVLVMEAALGIDAGHAEARGFVETWLRRWEPSRRPRPESRPRPAAARIAHSR
jgi:AcrR family transcriptional regulator